MTLILAYLLASIVSPFVVARCLKIRESART